MLTHTHAQTRMGAISPVKDVGKSCQTFTKKSKFIHLFIYLCEFRVIRGITAALGGDISLESRVRRVRRGGDDVPGSDSFPPLISNQIK